MRNSLMVQRLRLGSSTAGASASIPGRGTKIQQTKWYSPKNKNDFFFYNERADEVYQEEFVTNAAQEIPD